MKDFKSLLVGAFLGLLTVVGVAQFGPTPPLISGGTPSTVTVIQNFNNSAVFNSNVVFNGAINYSTNAFPLSPGTTWSWTKYHQKIITNADFNVSAIGGLNASNLNEAELVVSNSAASQIICHLLFKMTPFGPLTTNDIYLAAGKMAFINGNAEGIGTSTNIVTLVQP